MHDKLFFFFDSEWVRIALPIVTAATVPTPAFQNYVLQQLALSGTDSVMGSVYQPFPQSVPFYQKMFSLYGNTNVTPLTVLGCPFDVGGVAPAIANDGNGCANKSCQLFQSGVFLVWKPVAEASNQATYQQLTRILDHPTARRGNLLDVSGLLRGIEFAHQHHMLQLRAPLGTYSMRLSCAILLPCIPPWNNFGIFVGGQRTVQLGTDRCST